MLVCAWFALSRAIAIYVLYGTLFWGAELLAFAVPGMREMNEALPSVIGLIPYTMVAGLFVKRGPRTAVAMLAGLTAAVFTMMGAGGMLGIAKADPKIEQLGHLVAGALGGVLALPYGAFLGGVLAIAMVVATASVSIGWLGFTKKDRTISFSAGLLLSFGLFYRFEGVAMIPGFLSAVAALTVASRVLATRAMIGDPHHEALSRRSEEYRRWRGTSFLGANIQNADLTQATLEYTDLRVSTLAQARLLEVRGLADAVVASNAYGRATIRLLATKDGSHQHWDRADLRDLLLADVDFTGSSLVEADLRTADLTGANVSDSKLTRAQLQGACLHGVSLDSSDVTGARVDILTYRRSGWDTDGIESLVARGLELVGLDAFPVEVQDRLLGTRDGLTLAFDTHLQPFDRFLIEGLIIATLGRDSDCRITEYRELDHTAIVRLRSSSRTDLEWVAEALYRRIWKFQPQADQTALLTIANLLQADLFRSGFEKLIERLRHLELKPGRRGRGNSDRAWRIDLPLNGAGLLQIALVHRTRLHLIGDESQRALLDTVEDAFEELLRDGTVESLIKHVLPEATDAGSVLEDGPNTADTVLLLATHLMQARPDVASVIVEAKRNGCLLLAASLEPTLGPPLATIPVVCDLSENRDADLARIVKELTLKTRRAILAHAATRRDPEAMELPVMKNPDVREGAEFPASVVFVVIKGLKACSDVPQIPNALRALNEALCDVDAGAFVLSTIAGVIVVVPDTVAWSADDLFKALDQAKVGLALKVGVTHGTVEVVRDIDDEPNLIGPPINIAARLATSSDNSGLLVHESYAGFADATLPASHWLHRSVRKAIPIAGKPQDPKFVCFPGPHTFDAKLPAPQEAYSSRPAVLVAYDLPKFSAGDRTQLRQRFTRLVHVFKKLGQSSSLQAATTLLSPGGDGGVLVLEGVNLPDAAAIASRLRSLTEIESLDHADAIAVETRIGVHYGPVAHYVNARGISRPTGLTVFVADEIASDDHARSRKGIIFTRLLADSLTAGSNQRLASEFETLPRPTSGPASGVDRFVERSARPLAAPAVDWQTFQVVPEGNSPASNTYLKIYAVPRCPRALAIDGDLFRAFREQVTEYFGIVEPTAPPWRPRTDAVELLWRKERVNAVDGKVPPPLALHWMRGHDGSVGFATTIESLFAPGQVSLMEVAIGCLQFVRFAEALLGEEVTLSLDFQPWKLIAVPGPLAPEHIRRIPFAGMPASMPGPDHSSDNSIRSVSETFSASDLATPFAKLADMLVDRWRRIYSLHELSSKQIANTLGILAREILHWGAHER